MRPRDMEVETGGGHNSEMGTVTDEEGKQIDDRFRCQPHPGIQRRTISTYWL